MAVLKLSYPNPNDGTTTYDQIEFGEATDADGTGASVKVTEDIDATNISPIHPGVTGSTYGSGDITKYYAARYKDSNAVNTTTGWSDWVLGGKDRWDSMFEQQMDDTANAVWSQAVVATFKQWALDAFYDDLFQTFIDTSLTIDRDTAPSYTYTVPFGIFDISEVATGDIDNITSRFKVIAHNQWKFENNKLHFMSLAGIGDDTTIRLVTSKKYLEVGDVPDRYDYLAMSHMKMNAYLFLSKDFPRFKEWAQLQDGTKVSFENLRVEAREFERKFKEDKAREADLALAINIQ